VAAEPDRRGRLNFPPPHGRYIRISDGTLVRPRGRTDRRPSIICAGGTRRSAAGAGAPPRGRGNMIGAGARRKVERAVGLEVVGRAGPTSASEELNFAMMDRRDFIDYYAALSPMPRRAPFEGWFRGCAPMRCSEQPAAPPFVCGVCPPTSSRMAVSKSAARQAGLLEFTVFFSFAAVCGGRHVRRGPKPDPAICSRPIGARRRKGPTHPGPPHGRRVDGPHPDCRRGAASGVFPYRAVEFAFFYL